MTLKHHNKKTGSWTIPRPILGGYARNPELDPNYRYLEEEDYIPTQKDPDMEIILEGEKDESISNRN